MSEQRRSKKRLSFRHRGLTLLDSSGWAQLSDLLEALPAGEVGPALDAGAFGLALQFRKATNMEVPDQTVPFERFKVWAVSAHPSLLLEPLSQWNEIAGANMDATLSTNSCENSDPAGFHCDSSALGELLDQLSTREDGLGHFPLVENFQDFSRDLLLRAKNFLLKADLLLVGEPAFLCWLLYEYKPVVGYLGNPLGAYLSVDWQMLFYDFVAKTGSLQLVFMSPPIAAQAYWQTGRVIPVVRPVANYLGVRFAPETLDVLITKQVYTFWDFQCILNGYVEDEKWHFRYMSHLKDSSWKAWSTYRAAVVLPYDAQTLVFYELYSLGMPLLVPEETLLPLFFMRSYGYDGSVQYQQPGWQLRRSGAAWGLWHQGSFNELRWWAMFSDLARLPHLLAWSSLAELLGHLVPTKLSATSAAMLQVTQQHRQRSLKFWRACLANGLGHAHVDQ